MLDQSNLTVRDLVDAVSEIGKQPGNEKYHPHLKMILWMITDYVKTVADCRGLKKEAVQNVMEILTEAPRDEEGGSGQQST